MDRRYKDRFYKFVMEMEFYSPIHFDKIVKKENKEQFIELIKDFIRFEDGKQYSFNLEISSDYTSFRKIKI